MPELFDSHYFSGQGPVFIGSRDATTGVPTGLEFAGDISAVELTPNIDRTDVLENVTGNRNIGASFRTKTEYGLRLVMKSVKPAHLARAIDGAATAKAASSVTDEAIKGYHDKFTKLDHVKVSSLAVTHTSGTPTYTEGTGNDYIAHLAEGMIEVLSGGSITDGQDLHADYSYAAQNHVKANPSDKDLVLVCPAINRANSSKRGRLTLHKINLDPGALSAIQDGDEESLMEITGKVLLDELRASTDQLFSYELED